MYGSIGAAPSGGRSTSRGNVIGPAACCDECAGPGGTCEGNVNGPVPVVCGAGPGDVPAPGRRWDGEVAGFAAVGRLEGAAAPVEVVGRLYGGDVAGPVGLGRAGIGADDAAVPGRPGAVAG